MLLAALLALPAPAATPACTLDSAVPASVREMARDPEHWLGRCVRLEGYGWGIYFYTDVAGVYAAWSRLSEDRENDGWLGLYYRPGTLPNPRLRRGTVYGIVHDCDRDYDADWEEGDRFDHFRNPSYCRYRQKLVLRRAVFRSAGPAAFERQTSDVARRNFGDLVVERPDLRPPPAVVELADRFLAALRAGDGPALRRFVTLWSEHDPHPNPEIDRTYTPWLLGEGASPLRVLRSASGAPQRAYFQEALNRRHLAYGTRPDWHVCFCKTADCNGRWPILAQESTAGPQRPYICLRAIYDRLTDDRPSRLGIERRDDWFDEPSP